MKRAMLILMILPFSIPVMKGGEITEEAGWMIGLDVFSIITGNSFGFNLNRTINNNWSIAFEIKTRSGVIPVDEIRNEHEADLGQDAIKANYSDHHVRHNISVRYWMDKVYKGPMLSFGLTSSEAGSAGICVGIGYACRISARLRAAAT